MEHDIRCRSVEASTEALTLCFYNGTRKLKAKCFRCELHLCMSYQLLPSDSTAPNTPSLPQQQPVQESLKLEEPIREPASPFFSRLWALVALATVLTSIALYRSTVFHRTDIAFPGAHPEKTPTPTSSDEMSKRVVGYFVNWYEQLARRDVALVWESLRQCVFEKGHLWSEIFASTDARRISHACAVCLRKRETCKSFEMTRRIKEEITGNVHLLAPYSPPFLGLPCPRSTLMIFLTIIGKRRSLSF